MDRITGWWRGDERSERKTGNEYERRYFREDLAAVRAHHDRCRLRTKGMSLTLQKRKREKERETRVAPGSLSPGAADLMGFDSRYNFSFSPSESSHFPQFHRVIYRLDNGSDFYLLNPTSRFLALPSICRQPPRDSSLFLRLPGVK